MCWERESNSLPLGHINSMCQPPGLTHHRSGSSLCKFIIILSIRHMQTEPWENSKNLLFPGFQKGTFLIEVFTLNSPHPSNPHLAECNRGMRIKSSWKDNSMKLIWLNCNRGSRIKGSWKHNRMKLTWLNCNNKKRYKGSWKFNKIRLIWLNCNSSMMINGRWRKTSTRSILTNSWRWISKRKLNMSKRSSITIMLWGTPQKVVVLINLGIFWVQWMLNASSVMLCISKVKHLQILPILLQSSVYAGSKVK